MKLSRLKLNPLSGVVHRVLGDSHRLHQFVMSGFATDVGPSARRMIGVLHRIDLDRERGTIQLLVQSAGAPDWSRLAPGTVVIEEDGALAIGVRELTPLLESVQLDRLFAFRLRANTTKRLGKSSGDAQGKRVPVRGDEARRTWLGRNGDRHGFALSAEHELRIDEIGAQQGGRSSGSVCHAGALFDGVLRVTEPTAFRDGLVGGIGPAKAYGFGLLSIAVPR